MFSLVRNGRGRKVIRWGNVALTFVISTALVALVAAGLYGVIAGSWDSRVLLIGPIAGVVATLIALILDLRTPLQRLPILHWK